MAISLNSPNVDNYVVGKGIVSMKFEGEGGYVDVGNVTEMEFTPTLEKLDHFSSRQGVKEKDKSVIIQKSAELRLIMEEATARNMGLMLLGTPTIGGAAATGTLTASANAANGDTVTIGSKVYTFQTVLTNVDGNVFIGGSASASLDNLIDAINLGAGAGVDYAAATTVHPTVSAVAGAGDTVTLTAKTGGAAGNSIATTESSATLSFGAATLTGGVDGTASIDILSENVRVTALKYVGTNEIGPKWNFTFPRVEFSPSSAINPISEEWFQMEATGEVVAVNGSFGIADAIFVDTVPVNQVLPAIIHTTPPNVGETLTAFPGQWTGNPTFAYQWQKGGVDIPGAITNTYVPVGGDIGATLTVEIDATNSAGTVQAESPATAAVV